MIKENIPTIENTPSAYSSRAPRSPTVARRSATLPTKKRHRLFLPSTRDTPAFPPEGPEEKEGRTSARDFFRFYFFICLYLPGILLGILHQCPE